MVSTLAHAALVVAALAACGLWWRHATDDAGVRTLVGAGLLLRIVPGLALFWISYARLPIASSLQLEPGFWFFGLDAETYYRLAADAAARGWAATATVAPLTPSVIYVKLLAAAIGVFGRSPATSLLLNLIAYLALVAAILQWHRRLGVERGPLLFSLGVVSLTPSWILWSFQPLKDTVFLALIGVLFCALDAWYTRLANPRFGWIGAAALVGTQALLVYAASGIRWYFPLLVCALAPLALVALLLTRRRPAAWRLALGVIAIMALAEVVPIAGGPYVPGWIRSILRPSPSTIAAQLFDVPLHTKTYLQRGYAASLGVQGATEVHVRQDEGRAMLPDVGRTTSSHSTSRIEVAPWSARLRGMLAVMLLPRALAMPVGHVTVGGGHSLWLFVDLDTVSFELAVVFAAVVIGRQLAAGGSVRPVFWHLLAVTVLIALLLAAEGSNFGTLFRMRSMITLGVALLPLGIGRASAR